MVFIVTDKPAPWRPAVTDGPYTHEVFRADGYTFSIHRSAEDAQHWADRIGGVVRPYVPNPSTYWDGSKHYDH